MLSDVPGRPAGPVDRAGWRAIRQFAYVDRAFHAVRRSLAEAPHQVLAEPSAELRVHRAGLDLAREVRMTVGELEVGIHSASLPIRWEAATRPGLYPILEATLEVAPVRAGHRSMTQLGLFGHYRPPFGRLGALADNLAGQGIVIDSIDGFLDDLVDRFGATLPEPVPEDAPEPAGPPAHPAGRRRIILPADHLDRSAGGAAGLSLRLLAVPGVLNASVNPRTGLAVIDYDGDVCDPGTLLHHLEDR